jgi:hypothetical protein
MADLCPSEIETIWLEITLPNKHKILISSLYRPPNADIKNFNINLENLFDNVCSDKEILVLGDLNCDLAAKNLPLTLRSYANCLISINLNNLLKTLQE